MKEPLQRLFDKIIDWAYEHGYVEQLAKLATNTAFIRSLALTISSAAVGKGLVDGSFNESLVALIVVIITWSINEFVDYAKNRHTGELQDLVGAERDEFFGKETFKAVKTALKKDEKD